MKRLLLVDDNTEYLQFLSSVLSGDFNTIKATGVKDALDILQAITVDAICSDFNMKDGMKYCWIWYGMRTTPTIPERQSTTM